MIATLDAERTMVEGELWHVLRRSGCEGGNDVADAMKYSVLGGGQRLRPLLALRIGRLAAAETDLVLRGAVAVELLHCASLIVDDLPCMDNGMLRRGRPAVHRVFGEATAVLAAFSLVALAARQTLEGIDDQCQLTAMTRFQSKLLEALDCNSLVGGQALDLAGGVAARPLAEKKTAPLFALAARAGLMGATVDWAIHHAAIEFGYEFGVAYQLIDDFADGDIVLHAPVESQVQRTRDLLNVFGSRGAGLAELLDHVYSKSHV